MRTIFQLLIKFFKTMRKLILSLLPFLAIAEAQSQGLVNTHSENTTPIRKQMYQLDTICNPFASGRGIKHTKMNYRQQQRLSQKLRNA